MGERKVLNKYYPPDFDYRAIPRNRRPKNEQIIVRTMLPFNIRCLTCGEYSFVGRKFNARKEQVLEETYLGIKIWRFYIKCPMCSSEITWKTDPKGGGYICEHGAKKNFETWQNNHYTDRVEAAREAEAEEEAEEKGVEDLLDERREESMREMQDLENLQDLRERVEANAEFAAEQGDQLIDMRRRHHAKLEDDEEELVRQTFASRRFRRLEDDDDHDEDDNDGEENGSSSMRRRIDDGQESKTATEDLLPTFQFRKPSVPSTLSQSSASSDRNSDRGGTIVRIAVKRKSEDSATSTEKRQKTEAHVPPQIAVLSGYSSSDDE